MRRDLKALIADDSEIQRIQIAEWLESLGYECHSAVDGREAFELLSLEAYDLVIVDNAMPLMTGLDLVKAYYQDHLDKLVRRGAVTHDLYKRLSNHESYKDAKTLEKSREITRAHFPSIIMLTAEPLRIEKDLASFLGIEYWIIKPIGLKAFSNLIHAIQEGG
jgi:CheY-like chemotaxis protein